MSDIPTVKSIIPQDPAMPCMRPKERVEIFVFIAPTPGYTSQARHPLPRYTKAVEARVYRSHSGGTYYCLFWARSRNGEIRTHGHGKAVGYGYCKTSAAIDAAVSKAGIQMTEHFDGRGQSSAALALEAIAKRLGWRTGELTTF